MNMSRSGHRVVVTGLGAFSAFGAGVDVLASALVAGRTGFREVTRFTTLGRRAHTAAHADGDPTLADVWCQVGHEALGQAGLEPGRPAGLFLGTQGQWTGLTAFWREGSRVGVVDALAADQARALGIRLGLGPGQRRVYTNACAASATALAMGVGAIRAGRESVAIVGGGYLVDEEFFAKFDSGRALSTEGRILPFDRRRSGLLLGDGVALLILESYESAQARGAPVLAEVVGTGLTSDSHHVCRPHPEGAGLEAAIRRALVDADLPASFVGYVNAHGTGTAANDPAEAAALLRVFGTDGPAVSSTKSMTGHALEGSGALEGVVGVLALNRGVLPPTAGLTDPDPACDLDHVTTARATPVEAVLSVSAAFGGVNAALLFGRAA